MAKFLNNDLATLSHELTLSPRRLRVKQIRGIEKLLTLVEPDRAYPVEFVWYHVTGYQKRGSAETGSGIPGKALTRDLVTLAEVISRKSQLTVKELGQPYCTHQQLAERLKVSTKTIRRWRNRGLMGIRAVFDDGVNRLAFLHSTVDWFVGAHRKLVDRGSAFSQLTSKERDRFVRRARELLERRPLKLHAAARIIAEETGRAVETVRYTLRRFDEGHRDRALFARGGKPVRCERHQAIWCCHEAGEPVEAISQAFGCTAAEVDQILRTVQVEQWAEMSWECIHDERFDAPDADAAILDAPELSAGEKTPTVRPPKDVPPYLRSLYTTPLLSREQEHDLFRRYNYLKYKVARTLRRVDAAEVTADTFNTIRCLIHRTEEMKQRIIRANLRLVVSIAKRHAGRANNFFEIVSDGNVSLMRAVERFDYARGTKFSTYATWAVMKNYARSIPQEHYRKARFVTGQQEALETAADPRDEPVIESDRRRVAQLIADGMRELTQRERDIVSRHFGLGGRNSSHTLEQLGRSLGVTKERVRQIEQRALARLREVLAPSLVEALPD